MYMGRESSLDEVAMALLGRPAVEVLSHLISRHSEIAFFNCIEYEPKEREDERKKRRKPCTLGQEAKIASLHDTKGRKLLCLPRDSGTSKGLRSVIDGLPVDRALALMSRVTLCDGSERHIPLIDFQCKPTKENLSRVEEGMKRFDICGGIILKTAKSYHYYSNSILEYNDWLYFMYECLLVTSDGNKRPIVDTRYIGHRLKEGWGSLRISKVTLSKQIRKCPKVVRVVRNVA